MARISADIYSAVSIYICNYVGNANILCILYATVLHCIHTVPYMHVHLNVKYCVF
jgi:hypothetical protein